MRHDFEQKEVCSNTTSGSSCKLEDWSPRKFNGAECHGYMDYPWNHGNHAGNNSFTKHWSHCSVHDFKAYVKRYSRCGPFCRRCKGFCLKPISDETTEGSEMEHSDACEILPFVSNSSAACDVCDHSNATTAPHCEACLKALGLSNAASVECFATNPNISRCNPKRDSTMAEIAACVEADCSSKMLGKGSSWGLKGECYLFSDDTTAYQCEMTLIFSKRLHSPRGHDLTLPDLADPHCSCLCGMLSAQRERIFCQPDCISITKAYVINFVNITSIYVKRG